MKRRLLISGFLALLSAGFAGTASADLINGDFSGGLAGWISGGDVTSSGETAALGDGADLTYLYQVLNDGPGGYTISFDFMNGLSGDLSQCPSGECFGDVFSAYLYFADDAAAFPDSFSDAAVLMDLDSSGAYNTPGDELVSDLGNGWSRYSFSFTTTSQSVIPYFTLFDYDFAQNSQVILDNVSVTATAVPEPATVLLLGAGLGLVPFFRRRRIAEGRSVQG